jgi:hypothetical protein
MTLAFTIRLVSIRTGTLSRAGIVTSADRDDNMANCTAAVPTLEVDVSVIETENSEDGLACMVQLESAVDRLGEATS